MPSWNVRSYFFVVLSVLTAIPVLWLGRDGAQHLGEEARRLHDEALMATARDVGLELATSLQSHVHDIELLAVHLEDIDELDSERARDTLRRHFRQSGYFTGMYVADAEANVLWLGQEHAPEHAGVNYADRDYYRQLKATGSTAISRVQPGRFLQAPSVQIAAPLSSPDGSLRGYVEGSLSMDAISALVVSRAAGLVSGRVVVLDGVPGVVADSADRALQTRGAPAQQLVASSASPSTATDATGRVMRVHAVTLPAPLEGWRVVAMEPQAMIDASADAARRRTWLTTLVALLGALLMSAVTAHWVGRRFAGLATAVQAIGKGDFVGRVEPPLRSYEPREVGVLLTQIEHMAASLQRQTDDLEALVAERTSELGSVNERLELLVSALERAGDGIEITDPKARYIYVNPAIERMTGYSKEELLGQSPSILRSGKHDESFYTRIQRACQEGRVFNDQFEGRRKDGSLFEQDVTVWPVSNDAGETTHIVCLRRDITQRRRTERALAVSERMASIGTLAAGVAHEVNNPLTYMLLSLRQVEGQLERHDRTLPVSFKDKVGKAVSYAIEGAERVQSIVSDLRALSRADDTSVRFVNPAMVVDSALRMVASDLRHRARLERNTEAMPGVMVNPGRLSQVLVNLLVNAIQALPEGPAGENLIMVNVGTTEDGEACVEVRDNGEGIPEENLAHIFDPFFTTKPVGVGTGIGLSMCHSYVTSLGGRIDVRSEVGRGSSFRVVLPAAAEKVPAGEQPTEPFHARRAPVSRVLVVDDDPAVATALALALDRHEVTTVHRGEEALVELQRSDFDIVLCDVMMPGLPGPELYERVTRLKPVYRRRFIFMTGGVPREQALRLAAWGAVCLSKPLSGNQLERAMAQGVTANADDDTSSPQLGA